MGSYVILFLNWDGVKVWVEKWNDHDADNSDLLQSLDQRSHVIIHIRGSTSLKDPSPRGGGANGYACGDDKDDGDGDEENNSHLIIQYKQ